ncbi:hypothetical protein TNIN_157721 [Trichonephila inaurata madagascariensis]|uniref:Uncharacterized protein n=1 Tax=Trichonephila inaurata madagascariensis TaxID=2747483 RepID=A0A8X6IGM4_9ARAC|nr:hypothetical protein TNIN_157721 [Trichonephila inaurata madagascariensis]
MLNPLYVFIGCFLCAALAAVMPPDSSELPSSTPESAPGPRLKMLLNSFSVDIVDGATGPKPPAGSRKRLNRCCPYCCAALKLLLPGYSPCLSGVLGYGLLLWLLPPFWFGGSWTRAGLRSTGLGYGYGAAFGGGNRKIFKKSI